MGIEKAKKVINDRPNCFPAWHRVVLCRMLDALAGPDKIEKPRKILRAYQRGFRVGYQHGKAGTTPPPAATTEFLDAEYAEDQAERDAAYNAGYEQSKKDFIRLMQDMEERK